VAVWQLVYLSDFDKPIGFRKNGLRGGTILWLVAANVLAVWAHYFGWLMVGIELVLVFAVPLLRPVRVKMLAAAGITALLSLPWAGVVLARAGESLRRGTWVDVPTWEEPYNMLLRWSNAPVVAVLFLVLIALALSPWESAQHASSVAVEWFATDRHVRHFLRGAGLY
jgi:hypothetical protein